MGAGGRACRRGWPPRVGRRRLRGRGQLGSAGRAWLAAARGDAETEDGAWLDGQAGDLTLHRAEIDQATGMLTVQLGVPAAEAYARLRAYAYAQDRRLADVAGEIIARRLRLPRDRDPGGGP